MGSAHLELAEGAYRPGTRRQREVVGSPTQLVDVVADQIGFNSDLNATPRASSNELR
jgi:hypothetical protein